MFAMHHCLKTICLVGAKKKKKSEREQEFFPEQVQARWGTVVENYMNRVVIVYMWGYSGNFLFINLISALILVLT